MGSTFGGGPLACALIEAVIGVGYYWLPVVAVLTWRNSLIAYRLHPADGENARPVPPIEMRLPLTSPGRSAERARCTMATRLPSGLRKPAASIP